MLDRTKIDILSYRKVQLSLTINWFKLRYIRGNVDYHDVRRA